jgi:hypothetical protein
MGTQQPYECRRRVSSARTSSSTRRAMSSASSIRTRSGSGRWTSARWVAASTIGPERFARAACRRPRIARNLTVEVELDGQWHAEVVLQESGAIDLGTKARPWELGKKGWAMRGAPSAEMRKYPFGPDPAASGLSGPPAGSSV